MALPDLILGLVIGLLFTLIVFWVMRLRLKFKIASVQAEFEKMWLEQEGHIRKDASHRSRLVLKGKIAEHMVPLISEVFRYNPSDARFIGAPIDYVIFDGYSEVKDGGSDTPITVVLADVKTGEARLNRTERKIKEAVEAGRVVWETIRIDL